MLIEDMSMSQLSYAIAKAKGHHWRYPWLLEQEGYVQWLRAEKAHGYPHANWNNGDVPVSYITELAIESGPMAPFDPEASRWYATARRSKTCVHYHYADSWQRAVAMAVLQHLVGGTEYAIPEGIP